MTAPVSANPQLAPNSSRWRESRWLTALEVVLIVALAAGDFYELVPVTSTPYFLLLGWISLRLRRMRWRDVGLSRPSSWPRALIIGCAAGIAMELFSTYVTVPLLSRLAGKPPDLSDFASVVGNLKLMFLWIAISWVLAAFGEELAFRGYVMNRFADAGNRSNGAWLFSLLAVSALFGWSHGGQGLTGMLQEGFAGFLLGALYLACRRNLWPAIVAHGVSNTVAFILIYLDRYPGV